MSDHHPVIITLYCDAATVQLIREATCLPVSAFHTVKDFAAAVRSGFPIATFVDLSRGEVDKCLEAISDVTTNLPYSACIAFLSGTNDETLVNAFSSGAHDALRRPFRTGELLARLQARTRDLHRIQNAHELRVGDLVINQTSRLIQRGHLRTNLSPTAFTTLRVLAETPDLVTRREQIKEKVWPHVKVADGALDRHIHEIRKALQEVKSEVSVGSVYGEGFVLITKEASEHSSTQPRHSNIPA